MKKKSILLLLALGVVVGLFMAPSVALADTWTDISDAQWVSQYGVTAAEVDTVADGYDDHTFRPTNQVTRAQFTKMAVNGLDVDPAQPATPTFSDVPKSNIFYSYIEGAAAAGLVNGIGGGKFGPGSAITRQNVAAILGRWLSEAELDALGSIAGTTPGTHYASIDSWYAAEGAAQLAAFTDSSSITTKMKPWVAYLAARDIAKGSSGSFNPGSNITRAQAAVLVLRTLDVGEGSGTEVPTVTSINPATGPATGGTVVLITGANFTSGATVKFGTVAATNVTFNNATQIIATSPAGTVGSKVQVSVTTTAGTSANTAADDFTYVAAVPTVTALVPSAGAATGGESVSITGTNFTADATVKFGTVAATGVTFTSATKLTAVAPAGTAGTTVQVSVTTAAGTSADTSADNYAYGKPVVSSISPVTGPAAGGTTVIINGTGFTDDVTVKFGTTSVASASVTVDSPIKITVKSPAGTAGQMVQVSVTNDEGTSSDTANDNFTYAGTGPSITSLTPSAGDSEGGDEVLIRGTNFPTDDDDLLTIYFGTREVDPDDIDLDSATQMTVEAPEPLTEYTVVDVKIITEKGTSPNTSADDYSYGEPVITTIAPEVGDPAGGFNMTITGTGFTADAKVYWDGVALASAKVTVNSPTQITVVVPAGDDGESIDVMVENDEGESNEEEFEYDADRPYITSISPTAGDADGGDTVTITGKNFPSKKGDVTVTFGDEEVDEDDITSIISTKIVVKAPAPALADDDTTEVVDVMVETDDGESPDTPADDYSYGRARVDGIEPNTGDPEGGTVVTITGTGFVKGVSVYFDTELVDSGDVTVISPTEIRVIAPSGTDGDDVRVKVKNAEGTSADGDSDDDEFTYDDDWNAPIVTSVSPGTGLAAGGTEVTIEGSKFTIGAKVYFGSVEATDVDFVSSTELVAISPEGTEGKKVHITVKVGDETSDTDYDNDAFTYIADGDPNITSISPAYGPLTGGSKIVITGTGFSSEPTVRFIGSATVKATSVTVLSTTKLEVTVPAISTSAFANDDLVDISVQNTEDTDTEANVFQYFKYIVEYSEDNWSTDDVLTADSFDAAATLDLRLQVLDGDSDPIADLDLSELDAMLYYYRSTSDLGKVSPASATTNANGYVFWNDFGNFTNKTYTVYVGFDLTGDGDLRDSGDSSKSASWEWGS